MYHKQPAASLLLKEVKSPAKNAAIRSQGGHKPLQGIRYSFWQDDLETTTFEVGCPTVIRDEDLRVMNGDKPYATQ